MAISGAHPCLGVGGEIAYLSWCLSGASSCAQHFGRSTTLFSSLLTYPVGSTSVITVATDYARAAQVKMHSAGRGLVAVIPYGGTLQTFLSKNDGYTWSQVS